MKILHTSDWHVGRKMRGRDRSEEHRAVLDEIVGVATDNQVDLTIVAGDVFDSGSPVAASEEIVWSTLLGLAEVSPVVVVAGNHDSPHRLDAVAPLLAMGRITALGSYMIPKIEVQVAGTMRSDQGGPLAANWAAPNSATVGLNRPFAGVGSQTITVNLIEPGTLYGQRVNQFDVRFAKILRIGRTRSTVGVDVYNITNSAAILTYNQTFVATTDTWLRPNSVLQPRFVKLSAQIDF